MEKLMKILIIGGTLFVGRHLVEAALDAGHEVTLFNRGRTNPGAYPEVEELHGDRDGQLDALKGRTWDVVFDPSGYVPRVVRQSAELLHDSVDRYVFVSSISVYEGLEAKSEDDPVIQLDDPSTEEVLAHYGGLKAACEQVVTEIYGNRGLNVRPGFIVGPYDPTSRLPYLLRRFDKGGERIAGRPEQPVQIIDARDLADWMLHAAQQGLSGPYNLTGRPFPMRELLENIVTATGKPTTITYVGDAFLQEHEVAPIDGLTYWVPENLEPFMQVSIERALTDGLSLRPIEYILSRTLDWVRSDTQDEEATGAGQRMRAAVLTPEREAELLNGWHTSR
jgi:2'-hydroxyisoflavone reductase